MLSVLAIVVSLLLLMFFAYRGYSVLLLAPLMAAVAVVLSGEGGWMLPIYTETFMSALGNYLLKFFPVFLLGALFGQLMADSGAAGSIAKYIMRLLSQTRHSHHYSGLRFAHLWRCVFVCGGVCHFPDF